jgi:hypothetical protein
MLHCNGNIVCSTDGRPERANDHSSSSLAEVKNVCDFTSVSYGISRHSAQREFDALLLSSTDINRKVLGGGGVQKRGCSALRHV